MFNLKLEIQNWKSKGQAMVELAIFGSILIFAFAMLVRYGMGQNYSQRLQMDAFRRAVAANTNDIHSYGNSVSYTLIEDLPTPDPRDKFGFPGRFPKIATSGVTRSNGLYREACYPEFEGCQGCCSESLAESFLPRVTFRIGDDSAVGGVKVRSFTTAGFKMDESRNWRKRVSIKNYTAEGDSSPSWDWQYIQFKGGSGTTSETMWYWDECTNTGVCNTKKDFEEGMSADLDGDGKEERLVAVFTELNEEEGEEEGSTLSYTTIKGVGFIDYQEGEIDLTAEPTKDDPDNEKQGFRGEYESQTRIEQATLNKKEDSQGIKTSTSLNGWQKIKLLIRGNPAQGYDDLEVETEYDTDESRGF